MTSFREREQAIEAKFAHDEETRFLIMARRDKLFARWAAAAIGQSAQQADLLIRDLLAIPNEPGHDDAILGTVDAFLRVHGHVPATQELSAALDRCHHEAAAALS
jgi:hypothetical protein